MTTRRPVRIVLGVTGSIAAIKATRIAEGLRATGAHVSIVATESALAFVTMEELQAVSDDPVVTTIFRGTPEAPRFTGTAGAVRADTWHVDLGRAADLMLIAPCSATTIGKLRVGIYDNPVALLAASLRDATPLLLAPAMDEDMWLKPAVQESLAWLVRHGAEIIGPTSGPLASGLIGLGRLTEPEEIVAAVTACLARTRAMAGKRVLITAGPTYEPIDAVRFIGNRSSGKMGMALAEGAARMGAEVTLIMGPSALATPVGVHRVNVETAEEMLEAVRVHRAEQDVLIMSAAVSDFAPASPLETKMKKREGSLASIELRSTTDILAETARTKRSDQILVGFALEKGDRAEDYALGKLREKDLDLIVLNNLAEPGAGFGHDTNRVTLFTRSGSRHALPLMTKAECARAILQCILDLPTTA